MKHFIKTCTVKVCLCCVVLICNLQNLSTGQEYYQMEDNAISHFHKGQMWMDLQQYEAAILEFQIAIRLKPTTSMTSALYNDLGMAYLKIKEFPKAIVSFQQALTLDPNFSLYYENLVKAYKQSGSTLVIKNQLEQITDKDSDNLKSWYLLGLLNFESGDMKASRHAFEICLQLAPHSQLADAAKLYLDRFQAGQISRE